MESTKSQFIAYSVDCVLTSTKEFSWLVNIYIYIYIYIYMKLLLLKVFKNEINSEVLMIVVSNINVAEKQHQ